MGGKEENPRVSWGTWKCLRERRNAGTLEGMLGARERDGRLRMNISGFMFPS